MKRFLAYAALGLAIAGPTACATSSEDDAKSIDTGDDAIAAALVDDNAPLLVKNPPTLMQLEDRGLDFPTVFGVAQNNGKALMSSPKYKAIVDTVTEDLRVMRLRDPRSGPGVDFQHTQFDPTWLASAQARFELVGIVNRTDRLNVAGCGEFRYIYRLAYTASRSASRLPMTVNVVFPQPDDGQKCATVAKKWLAAKNGSPDALLAFPLKDHQPMGSVEINLQAVRWASDKRPDFGGYAEYILRVFEVKADGKVVAKPLENTPRTSDLDPGSILELKKWIGDHLEEIDNGKMLLPEKFLTQQAISVSPRGMERENNKPYQNLFPDAQEAFGRLDFTSTKLVKSPEALIRRLDTMTCHGCHQARSVAGFHFLGEERDNAARLNALAIGRSPHMVQELPWRTDYLKAVAEGRAFTEPRPFAEHPQNEGKYGSHCGLGDKGFADWTCAPGLVCTDLGGDPVGFCSPPKPGVGDACESGNVIQNDNPHQDTVVNLATLTCDTAGQAGARCNPSRMGWPNGMCRVDCTADQLGQVTGDTVCGLVPQAKALTKCLFVDKKPFPECLESANNLTNLRMCDGTENCRDDYACTRVKNGPPGVGSCMPPYFAFQARVDGHQFDE